ncbi:hypothetical protein [Flavobacterium sp.]|uniref:hypothetical protein n=1 Tax=Flavobacterium sp. TaxID=239 RepID=UPI0039E3200E
MNTAYRKFYRSFFARTHGFIPAKPLNHHTYPGDFFQIRGGEMFFIGNIFTSGIVDPEKAIFEHGIRQNPEGWHFGDGVSKPYCGRGTGHSALEGEFEFSKQILAFESQGSFLFRAHEPESVKIANWSALQNELILKLTQTHHSFRDLYLVTETASTSDWTLAVSGGVNGELEIATDAQNYGLTDIFGDAATKTIQSKDIEYYFRESKRRPCFFRAKKLIVQQEKIEVIVEELISQRSLQNEWAADFYDFKFHHNLPVYAAPFSHAAQASVLDLLPGNQLNPNTALAYFKWTDANAEDIEKLFPNYGV